MHQMSNLINETAKLYDHMQWREGLHAGFFEFQITRDTYRDICVRSNVAMHRDVIFRFIEAQIIMLSPITPHFCEHIWALIGKKGFVTTALWPETFEVDFSLLRAGDFLNKTVRHFREALVKGSGPQKKGKKPAVETAKPTHAHVYLSSEFPEWQQTVLVFMSSVFDAATKEFPADFMKLLKDEIAKDDSLKKITKNVMQFAAFVKSEASLRGQEALELQMPFNQKDVLASNKAYLVGSLELEDIQFFDVADEIPNADAKKLETATPGKPAIHLYAQ
jgi:leucyl-tRNA synthetase